MFLPACPVSSNAITITAAPNRRTRRACCKNTAANTHTERVFVLRTREISLFKQHSASLSPSPSFNEMELTMLFPCMQRSATSRMANLDESATIGTDAMSGLAVCSSVLFCTPLIQNRSCFTRNFVQESLHHNGSIEHALIKVDVEQLTKHTV